MKLALAIPVWNDALGLSRLLAQVGQLGCFDQIVVVDDGSNPALDLTDQTLFPSEVSAEISLLRNETPQGAGQARNRALAVVEASHVLFFDADDVLTDELPALWRSLAGRDFDFCIFKHADSRLSQTGGWGQTALDEGLWRLAGCSSGALQLLPEAGYALLAQTANYPWNKIYRTEFLRRNRIRFSEIPVHNDILAHWMGFIHARTVLVSDRVAAVHFIRSKAERLTNRRGAERLRVLEPLQQVVVEIRRRQGCESALMAAFLRFSSGLFDWMRGNIDPSLHRALDRAVSGFLADCIDRNMMASMVSRDPVLALRLMLMLMLGQERDGFLRDCMDQNTLASVASCDPALALRSTLMLEQRCV